MKSKALRTILGACLALCLSNPSVVANEQQALTRGQSVQQLMLNRGFTVKVGAPDFLKPGASRLIKMKMYGYQSYLVAVAGDDNTMDVDVAVYDPKGARIVQDNEPKPLAVTLVGKRDVTQEVYIRVSVGKFKPGAAGGHCVLVVGFS